MVGTSDESAEPIGDHGLCRTCGGKMRMEMFRYAWWDRAFHAAGLVVALLACAISTAVVIGACATSGEWGALGVGLAIFSVIWVVPAGYAFNGLVFKATRYWVGDECVTIDTPISTRHVSWGEVSSAKLSQTMSMRFVSMQLGLNDGTVIVIGDPEVAGAIRNDDILVGMVTRGLAVHGTTITDAGFRLWAWGYGAHAHAFLTELMRRRGHRIALLRRLIM